MREIIFALFPIFLVIIGCYVLYMLAAMLMDFIYHRKYIADMGTRRDRRTIYNRGRAVANRRLSASKKYGLALYEKGL